MPPTAEKDRVAQLVGPSPQSVEKTLESRETTPRNALDQPLDLFGAQSLIWDVDAKLQGGCNRQQFVQEAAKSGCRPRRERALANGLGAVGHDSAHVELHRPAETVADRTGPERRIVP